MSGGRDPGTGRFTAGNRFGVGNPHAGAVSRLRAAALEITTPERVQRVFDALLQRAEQGDVKAAKLVLLYTLGRPDSIARNEDREEAAALFALPPLGGGLSW